MLILQAQPGNDTRNVNTKLLDQRIFAADSEWHSFAGAGARRRPVPAVA